jgi:hypothetical protein
MKRIAGLFTAIRGQSPRELVYGEFLQGALGRGGGTKYDDLGACRHIDGRDPYDATAGPHFDADFAMGGATLSHWPSRDSMPRIMRAAAPRRNAQR